MSWRRFLRRLALRSVPTRSGALPARPSPWCVRPRLERLENRIIPVIVTPRFSSNALGDIAIIGDRLETASTVNNPGKTQQDVTGAASCSGFSPRLTH